LFRSPDHWQGWRGDPGLVASDQVPVEHSGTSAPWYGVLVLLVVVLPVYLARRALT
jgi:hypothetical protein